MNLKGLKKELTDGYIQLVALDLQGKLLESDQSFLDLSHLVGKNVFEELDFLLGLEELVLGQSHLTPPILMPMVTFTLDDTEHLLNLEFHHRTDFILLLFKSLPQTMDQLRSMQQERNDSMILLEKIRRQEKELRETNQRLKTANQELDRFAYVVSHDLKSPLRGIRNLSEWIEESMEEGDHESLKSQVQLLHQRSAKMTQLIDAILEYSRAGRINLSPTEVDTQHLVEEIIAQFSPNLGITFDIQDQLPVLRTSRTSLYQVFSNLISNAVKYGQSPSGPSLIQIRYQDLPDHHQFSVTDNGPGIPESQHQRVFEIFETLTPSETSDSTGIGLSIAKKLVLEWGGEIHLDSSPGQGSSFTFTWKKA